MCLGPPFIVRQRHSRQNDWVLARLRLPKTRNSAPLDTLDGDLSQSTGTSELFYSNAAICRQFKPADKTPKSAIRPICDRAERGVTVNHVTICRWVQRYAPILNQRLRRERRLPNGSWRVDETYIRVAGKWVYLYRAVDSVGDTIDFMLLPNRDLVAAKHFLQLACTAPDASGHESLTCTGIRPMLQPFRT